MKLNEQEQFILECRAHCPDIASHQSFKILESIPDNAQWAGLSEDQKQAMVWNERQKSAIKLQIARSKVVNSPYLEISVTIALVCVAIIGVLLGHVL